MSGFCLYGEIILQLICNFQRDFPRNLQHSLKVTKWNSNVCFKFAKFRSHMMKMDCKTLLLSGVTVLVSNGKIPFCGHHLKY